MQSTNLLATMSAGKVAVWLVSSPLESTAQESSRVNTSNQKQETKWPEQSEELLGLIVNSLKALDGVVPHGGQRASHSNIPLYQLHKQHRSQVVVSNLWNCEIWGWMSVIPTPESQLEYA